MFKLGKRFQSGIVNWENGHVSLLNLGSKKEKSRHFLISALKIMKKIDEHFSN